MGFPSRHQRKQEPREARKHFPARQRERRESQRKVSRQKKCYPHAPDSVCCHPVASALESYPKSAARRGPKCANEENFRKVMARALYGVMGNMFGHVSRALAVAGRLTEHEFHFVGGGRVPEMLRGLYPVLEVPVAHTVYQSQQVPCRARVAISPIASPASPGSTARSST